METLKNVCTVTIKGQEYYLDIEVEGHAPASLDNRVRAAARSHFQSLLNDLPTEIQNLSKERISDITFTSRGYLDSKAPSASGITYQPYTTPPSGFMGKIANIFTKTINHWQNFEATILPVITAEENTPQHSPSNQASPRSPSSGNHEQPAPEDAVAREPGPLERFKSGCSSLAKDVAEKVSSLLESSPHRPPRPYIPEDEVQDSATLLEHASNSEEAEPSPREQVVSSPLRADGALAPQPLIEDESNSQSLGRRILNAISNTWHSHFGNREDQQPLARGEPPVVRQSEINRHNVGKQPLVLLAEDSSDDEAGSPASTPRAHIVLPPPAPRVVAQQPAASNAPQPPAKDLLDWAEVEKANKQSDPFAPEPAFSDLSAFLK